MADRLQRLRLAVEAEARSTIRCCCSGSRRTAAWTACRRSDSAAASAGSVASGSAKRSPSSPSPSSPTARFSETDASAAPSASSTWWSGRPAASASSSVVGSRPVSASRRRPDARQLSAPLVDVRRHADRPRLARDRALARLPDPPGRVRRELEAPPPVELLDGAVQSDHSLLDQVAEGHVVALVALRDRDDEAQVRVDHPLLRLRVAALDALRELDLLGGGQQVVPPDVVHEQRQRVRRSDGVGGGGVGLGAAASSVPLRGRDLDAARLELGAERGQLLVVEVVLGSHRLEGGGVDDAALLGGRRERRSVHRIRNMVLISVPPSSVRRLRARARRSKRSMRLPRETARSTARVGGMAVRADVERRARPGSSASRRRFRRRRSAHSSRSAQGGFPSCVVSFSQRPSVARRSRAPGRTPRALRNRATPVETRRAGPEFPPLPG